MGSLRVYTTADAVTAKIIGHNVNQCVIYKTSIALKQIA